MESVEQAKLQRFTTKENIGPAVSRSDTTHSQRGRSIRRLGHFLILLLIVRLAFGVKSWWHSPAALFAEPRHGDGRSRGMNSKPGLRNTAMMEPFNWTDLSPSNELNWTHCYGSFQCARLKVPLDYSERDGEEAAIAVIKYPSTYSPGHEKYKGPILFNPGGPGGSGVGVVLLAAPVFRMILGEQFDLIGFDPRGVGFTSPKLSLFPTSVEAGEFYLDQPLDINSTSSTLSQVFAHSKIFGKLVERRAKKVAQHLSTPSVARDMLSIINAAGEEKLQYWGFSYGSVLGATFAAMFPDKVKRIIIDGVVDAEDYYAGLWENNLRDTDAALMNVYDACREAGPSKCAIYENSTELIAQRLDRLLAELKKSPVPVFEETDNGDNYGLVEFATLKRLIFTTLYNPNGLGADFLAQAIKALEVGDGRLALATSLRRALESFMTCVCPASGEGSVDIDVGLDATFGIACGDAADSTETLHDVQKAYGEMAKVSVFADSWFPRSVCPNWIVHAKDRFNGSFEQNTSHPLLLIGNTADPVTPLWNAHKMSRGFNGSVVLTQNSTGHCSVSSQSICTLKAIKSYFVNGTLPEVGKICQPDIGIFPSQEASSNFDSLGAEDQQLFAAADLLHHSYFIPALGGGVSIKNIRVAMLDHWTNDHVGH